MNQNLVVQVVASAIFYGTPVVFAGLGNLIAERSGVLILGTEGMMLLGAVVAAQVATVMGGPAALVLAVAVIAGGFAGAAGGLLHGFMSISLRVNQTVSGLALTILAGAAGLSSYAANVWQLGTSPVNHQFTRLDVPHLTDLPIAGPILFHQTAMTYVSWLLVVAIAWYLFHSRRGLDVRAVGDAPASADAAGLNVTRIRYGHVVAGGFLAGVGGACVSLSIVPRWTDGVTGGQGWIAVALVVFAFWRPGLLLLGAYLFGALRSLNFVLQSRGWTIPVDVLDAVPYLATIVVLVVMSAGAGRRRFGAPAALGRPFLRGER